MLMKGLMAVCCEDNEIMGSVKRGISGLAEQALHSYQEEFLKLIS